MKIFKEGVIIDSCLRRFTILKLIIKLFNLGSNFTTTVINAPS